MRLTAFSPTFLQKCHSACHIDDCWLHSHTVYVQEDYDYVSLSSWVSGALRRLTHMEKETASIIIDFVGTIGGDAVLSVALSPVVPLDVFCRSITTCVA